MENTTSNANTEVSFSMQVNIQAAVITSLKRNWRVRSFCTYNRDRVRENVELLRFLRAHKLTAQKYSFAK